MAHLYDTKQSIIKELFNRNFEYQNALSIDSVVYSEIDVRYGSDLFAARGGRGRGYIHMFTRELDPPHTIHLP